MEKLKKLKKIKSNRVLIPVIMLLILYLSYLIMNFNTVCYKLNRDYYKESTATIKELTTDKLAMIVPAVKLEYKYKGKTYISDKYFVIEYLFNINRKANNQVDIYINEKQPQYVLYKTPFYRNGFNFLIIFLGILSIMNLTYKLKTNKKYKEYRKKEKLRKKHKKELKESIHKMYVKDIINGGKKNVK